MSDMRDSRSGDKHDHGSTEGELQCSKCKGTGRRRDKHLLVVAGIALLLAIITPPGADVEIFDDIEEDTFSPTIEALAMLGDVAAVIVVWTLYRYWRGICDECKGTGIRPEGKPAVPFPWRRDGERLQPWRCRQCGYDLTGNVSGRCPECGELIPPADRPPGPTDECPPESSA